MDPIFEPKRAGQYLISDAGSRSYDGGLADATIDSDPGTVVAIRTADELIVPWDPDALDGSEDPIGVIDGPVRAGAGAVTKRVSVCVREAEVDFSELTFPEGLDIDDLREVLPKLTFR